MRSCAHSLLQIASWVFNLDQPDDRVRLYMELSKRVERSQGVERSERAIRAIETSLCEDLVRHRVGASDLMATYMHMPAICRLVGRLTDEMLDERLRACEARYLLEFGIDRDGLREIFLKLLPGTFSIPRTV